MKTRSIMEDTRCTMNSAVCVRGTDGSGEDDYYGVLREVLQLSFYGEEAKVAIFNVDWFDNKKGRGWKIDNSFGLIDINNKKQYRGYDPFIMAHQAEQVYYTTYPSQSRTKVDWWSVCKVKARNTFDVGAVAYQEEFSSSTLLDDVGGGDEDIGVDVEEVGDEGCEEVQGDDDEDSDEDGEEEDENENEEYEDYDNEIEDEEEEEEDEQYEDDTDESC